MRGILDGHKETAEGDHRLYTGKQNYLTPYSLDCQISFSHTKKLTVLQHYLKPLVWRNKLFSEMKVIWRLSFFLTGELWEGARPSHHQGNSCRGAGVGVAGLYWQPPGQVRKSLDVLNHMVFIFSRALHWALPLPAGIKRRSHISADCMGYRRPGVPKVLIHHSIKKTGHKIWIPVIYCNVI